MISLRALATALLIAGCITSVQAQSLRPEVGKPLQQASDLLRAGKAKEALSKVREADAVGGKNPAEQLMIDRMRGAAAQRAGENGLAAQAFESAFNSGRLAGGEQAQMAESLAFIYSQLHDNGRAAQWAQKAQSLGANSAQLKQLQAYLQGLSGDYGAIAREAAAAVSGAEQAGRRPDEGDLLRLADAQQRTNNAAGQSATLEKLLAYYGKREYWAAALGRLPRKPGFSDRFAIDVMRLRFATGNMSKTEEYMELAQLALQAGSPTEAKLIVDKGFAAGALGTGAEAERHKRLRDLANKQEIEVKGKLDKDIAEASAARDGNALVMIGATLANLGQADKGVALIEEGIAKGGLKRPEEAKLRLGRAMMQTGKNKSKAQQVLRSVQGQDGAADIGRMWAILAGQQ
jgi:outer membrane murein-binding lipoprotein Lpp